MAQHRQAREPSKPPHTAAYASAESALRSAVPQARAMRSKRAAKSGADEAASEATTARRDVIQAGQNQSALRRAFSSAALQLAARREGETIVAGP